MSEHQVTLRSVLTWQFSGDSQGFLNGGPKIMTQPVMFKFHGLLSRGVKFGFGYSDFQKHPPLGSDQQWIQADLVENKWRTRINGKPHNGPTHLAGFL